MSGSQVLPDTTSRSGEILINPWSYQSIGPSLFALGLVGGLTTSRNYIAANIAVFVPFWVPEPTVITKLGWGNGTAVAGNIDAGVYAEDGTLIVSTGSTAQASVSVAQVVDVTDTLLKRDRYYLAITSDTSGVTQKLFSSIPAVGIPQSLGLLEMAAAPPLATNASPAVFAKYTRAFIPLVYAQGYRTIGP